MRRNNPHENRALSANPASVRYRNWYAKQKGLDMRNIHRATMQVLAWAINFGPCTCKQIGERGGFAKPYPKIDYLRNEGLITGEKAANGKPFVYSVTAKGRRAMAVEKPGIVAPPRTRVFDGVYTGPDWGYIRPGGSVQSVGVPT